MWLKNGFSGQITCQIASPDPLVGDVKIWKLTQKVREVLIYRVKLLRNIWIQIWVDLMSRFCKKNTIFHPFLIHFYRKQSKITCNVIPTPGTQLQGLIFCFQPPIGILDLWLKGLRGAFSSTLKWNDSQAWGSDRFRAQFGLKWAHFRASEIIFSTLTPIRY